MANPILINGLASPQSIFSSGTTKHHKVGTRGQLDDGRVFYYSALAAGASTLSRANLMISRPVVSTVTAQSTSGASLTVGATRISVDTSGAVSSGQLVDGFVSFQNSTGEGQQYKIRNHTTVGGAGVIAVDLYDPIVVAGSTTSELVLFSNPYYNVQATTTLGRAAGVVPIGVTSNASLETYFWTQSYGDSICLAAATLPAVGQGFIQNTVTAGAISVGAALTDASLGQAHLAPATALDFATCFLKIRA